MRGTKQMGRSWLHRLGRHAPFRLGSDQQAQRGEHLLASLVEQLGGCGQAILDQRVMCPLDRIGCGVTLEQGG